jgi:hypothetical protein
MELPGGIVGVAGPERMQQTSPTPGMRETAYATARASPTARPLVFRRETEKGC